MLGLNDDEFFFRYREKLFLEESPKIHPDCNVQKKDIEEEVEYDYLYKENEEIKGYDDEETDIMFSAPIF